MSGNLIYLKVLDGQEGGICFKKRASWKDDPIPSGTVY